MDTKAEKTISKDELLKDVIKIKEKLEKLFQQAYAKQALRNEYESCALILKHIQNQTIIYSQAEVEYWIDYGNWIINHIDGICYRLNQSRFVGSAAKELQSIIADLKNRLAPLLAKHDPYKVSADELSVEQFRYDEQCKLHHSTPLRKILDEIKLAAIRDSRTPTIFFISYAWPDEDKHQEAYTKDFVSKLAEQLDKAGLTCLLDQKDSGFGFPMMRFMRTSIRKANFVMVLCDRSLRFKVEDKELTGVVFEYLEIIEEMKKRGGDRLVVPLCLNKDSFVTGLFKMAAEISVYKDGYIAVLKEIIQRGYGYSKTEFEELWSQLASKYMPQNILNANASINLPTTQTLTTSPPTVLSKEAAPLTQIATASSKHDDKTEKNKMPMQTSAPAEVPQQSPTTLSPAALFHPRPTTRSTNSKRLPSTQMDAPTASDKNDEEISNIPTVFFQRQKKPKRKSTKKGDSQPKRRKSDRSDRNESKLNTPK